MFSVVVSNGTKDPLGAGEGASGSEEFEPWRSQQQNSGGPAAYGASVPISSGTDLYNMNTGGQTFPSQPQHTRKTIASIIFSYMSNILEIY